MKKAFRKLKLTTNVKSGRMVLMVLLVVLGVAVAYAGKSDATTSTSRKKIATGYYAKGEFKVELEWKYKWLKLESATGTASGETIWTSDSSGKSETDWAYVDCAVPYTVVQFVYDGGSYSTHSAPFLPIWEIQSPGTLKCNLAKETRPRLYDFVTRTAIEYAKKTNITASR